jgi:Putative transposase/Transposase zinc-binding domain
MLELADIFRVAGPAYRAARAGRLLPSHQQAMDDIVRCRTPGLGGSVYQCDACGAVDYAYHSCRNRHCPKCQEDRAQAWLTGVRARLLPCDHYLLTFTLPQELRALARAHQHVVYSALLQEAAAAVQTLAADRAWVGGQVGILAVLHTWTRTLDYHPHAHLLVTAGGLAPGGEVWVKPAHAHFLMPGYMLSELFRAKLRDALMHAGFADQIAPSVWDRRWTVHVQQIGHGDHAVRYLARYVFHVALTNARIRRFEHNRVTFSYTHARTQETRHLTLPVDAFIERFLQHVLPRGFTKIRYFGLLSPSCRAKLDHARHLLELHAASDSPSTHVAATDSIASTSPTSTGSLPTMLRCPTCHRGRLHLIEHVGRPRAPP